MNTVPDLLQDTSNWEIVKNQLEKLEKLKSKIVLFQKDGTHHTQFHPSNLPITYFYGMYIIRE
ncbi:hypothetical protein C6497_00375 [Candidatus Poribacteria bacterium]|nr:MAG: hypothetical protein C6497_00375 [Candidatus Poribacteria bacterium]